MSSAKDPAKPPERSPRSDRTNRLGASLRRAFDEVAAEPMPEAFEALLKQLR